MHWLLIDTSGVRIAHGNVLFTRHGFTVPERRSRMAEILQNITCAAWLVLATLVFVELRRWNRRFSDLYDKLKEQIEEEQDG